MRCVWFAVAAAYTPFVMSHCQQVVSRRRTMSSSALAPFVCCNSKCLQSTTKVLGALIVLTSLYISETAAQGQNANIDIAAIIQMDPGPTLISDFNEDFGVGSNNTAGGTFAARGDMLTSFTIYLHQNGETGDKFRAIVLGTDSTGVPQLPILWESVDQLEPVGTFYTPFTFDPNISLVVGRKYFIGVDTGRLTTVEGGWVAFGISSINTIPEGNVWRWDIPEPSAVLLAVLCTVLLSAVVPRESKESFQRRYATRHCPALGQVTWS
jgi:hypothetical protein